MSKRLKCGVALATVWLSHRKVCIDRAEPLMTRSHAVALNLFKTKSPDLLMAEAAAPERQLKRTLGALDLTAIGIGAIIGAGIFALTGTAAAGQVFSSRLETPVINFIQAWLSGGRWSSGGPGRVRRLLFLLLWRESHVVLLRFAMRN
jgi:hypothetical protein